MNTRQMRHALDWDGDLLLRPADVRRAAISPRHPLIPRSDPVDDSLLQKVRRERLRVVLHCPD
jgi:hypothetical protein